MFELKVTDLVRSGLVRSGLHCGYLSAPPTSEVTTPPAFISSAATNSSNSSDLTFRSKTIGLLNNASVG